MYDDLFFNGFIEAHIEACAKNSISFNLKDRVNYYAFETMFAKNSFKFNLDLDKFNFLMNILIKILLLKLVILYVQYV